MKFCFDLVLALLASYGIISLIWLLIGLCKRNGAKHPVYAVICADELNDQALRRALDNVKWLQQWGTVRLQPVVTSREHNPKLTKLTAQYKSELWMPYDIRSVEMK